MVTAPSKTTQGKVLAKERDPGRYGSVSGPREGALTPKGPVVSRIKKHGTNYTEKLLKGKSFKDLDFKDQDAIKAEAEMLAKKPVKKDSQGKPGIFNETIQGSSNAVEKHEETYMHGHQEGKRYSFLSHLIPPTKIKADSAVKKDTSRMFEITETQKAEPPKGLWSSTKTPNSPMTHYHEKGPKAAPSVHTHVGGDMSHNDHPGMLEKTINPFAAATAQAKKLGFKDFSEGSPGKEKRGEIAEKIKEQEGIKKAANINLSGENTQPGFTRNPISGRKVRFALGIRNPRKVLPPDSMTGMGPTTGVTSPQLRVE